MSANHVPDGGQGRVAARFCRIAMNWALLQNSLLVAGATTAMSVGLGFLAGLWMCGLERRWRAGVLTLAIAALALPPFLVTNCWLHYLGYTGVWRSVLPLNLFSLPGTVWVLTLMLWPITATALWAAWQRLEAAHLESDPMLRGAALLRWLLLPMSRVALALAATLTFVLALNNFAVPSILQVKVFPAELWVNFNTTFNYLAAARLAWPMVLAPLVLLLVIGWMARRETIWSWKKSAADARLFRRQLGARWFVLSGIVAGVLMIFSIGLPLWQLAGSARTWSELSPALNAGRAAVWNSFWFAALAATVVVAGALFVQLFAGAGVRRLVSFPKSECRNPNSERKPSGSCNVFGWLVWIPFLVPGVLLGIALIWLLNRPPLDAFYQSIGMVVLAFAVRYAAFGWNLVAHGVRTTDRDLLDAARLDSAGGWHLFRHVYWPQKAACFAAAWYVTYLFCLWDVETLVFIVPPGSETLSLRIFNLLHYGHNAQVNALCLLLLGLAMLPLTGWLVGRRVIHRASASPLPFPVNAGTVPAIVACLSLPLLAGCGGSSRSASDGQAPIRSEIFERVQIIGSRGTGAGQFNKPRSVAVDPEDNLYVADMTGRIQKFSPDGTYLLSWQMEETDLGRPKGMACDAEGNIIVIEPHYSRVNYFSAAGELLGFWGEHGTNDGQIAFPRAVAVNGSGEVVVCEYGLRERIQQFTADGRKLLRAFGEPGGGPGQLNRAEGLGHDAQDRLYVADSCNHRIQVFGPDGRFLRSHGRAGSGSGELSYPYDVRVDSAGRQYVCEFGNSRIQIFDAKDRSIEMIGGPGAAPGKFANPWSMAFDSKENLYVADSRNHRVQKFIRRTGVAGGRRNPRAATEWWKTGTASLRHSGTPPLRFASGGPR